MSGQGGLATEVKSEQSLTEARQSAMEIYEKALFSLSEGKAGATAPPGVE